MEKKNSTQRLSSFITNVFSCPKISCSWSGFKDRWSSSGCLWSQTGCCPLEQWHRTSGGFGSSPCQNERPPKSWLRGYCSFAHVGRGQEIQQWKYFETWSNWQFRSHTKEVDQRYSLWNLPLPSEPSHRPSPACSVTPLTPSSPHFLSEMTALLSFAFLFLSLSCFISGKVEEGLEFITHT